MEQTVNLWPLIGIAAIVIDFIADKRGISGDHRRDYYWSGRVDANSHYFRKSGSGFLNTRNLPLILLLPLAVIGLLERHGLKERAQAWIMQIKSATSGRLLIVYLFVREVTAAMGLTSLGGHPRWFGPYWHQWLRGGREPLWRIAGESSLPPACHVSGNR